MRFAFAGFLFADTVRHEETACWDRVRACYVLSWFLLLGETAKDYFSEGIRKEGRYG
jgi:hypothetical protein